jgi:Fis family transcriptional regulator, factor for inversion stimulation protein
MVISCVEKPMLEVVLEQAGGNQSLAAEFLGINRNTLRKKLQEHGLI